MEQVEREEWLARKYADLMDEDYGDNARSDLEPIDVVPILLALARTEIGARRPAKSRKRKNAAQLEMKI